MVNTQQTSTTVATASVGMVCMNILKIAKNCFYDVYAHICKCASAAGTNARYV